MVQPPNAADVGWRFFADPRDFLDSAAEFLAADPLQFTVMNAWARREAGRLDSGLAEPIDRPYWYAVHRRSGRVTAVAMRTAPFAPHPLWVPPMPEEEARDLGRILVARAEPGTEPDAEWGANGMAPAVAQVAEEVTRSSGRRIHVLQHQRLFQCREVLRPARPAGSLRQARPEEAGRVVDWLAGFHLAADEQAGHPGARSEVALPLVEVRHRILDGMYWVWCDPAGEWVHLSGLGALSDGIAGIGPVFTPLVHRGHGYAGWVVAELTQRVLDRGGVPYLFTDQANPVSGRLYQSLGYRAVCDAVQLRVR